LEIYKTGIIVSLVVGVIFSLIASQRREGFEGNDIIVILLFSLIGTYLLIVLDQFLKRRRAIFGLYLLLSLYLITIFLDIILVFRFIPTWVVQYQAGIGAALVGATITILLEGIEKRG
jgi:hypothetical protein